MINYLPDIKYFPRYQIVERMNYPAVKSRGVFKTFCITETRTLLTCNRDGHERDNNDIKETG